jgi:hypothetical protein
MHSTPAAPPPVSGLPNDPKKRKWYRTLDEAIHAWAEENGLHGPQEVPQIWVNVHSHIGGWSVG